MKRYIMALDQGTTSSRCILFDRQGKPVAMAQREFTQHYPQAGWVEHDPMEIWASQLSTATEALAMIGATTSDVEAIGITNQRETTIVWDRATGKPVYPAIVWQCRRTAEMVEQINASPLGEYIRDVTGLLPDAYFSATKLAWILDHVPDARARAERGELAFGTVDSWLIWNLTGGAVHATDYTNASRTMLFNIRELDWDERILTELRIPRALLPQAYPSSHDFGAASVLGGIPVTAAAGDQHAALFGQCCFDAGDVKNTYGTGCFLLMNTGETPVRSENRLLTTIAFAEGGKIHYALEGSVFVAGAAIQWLRDELHLLSTAAESEVLACSVPDTAGAYLVPAFTGLGAPHWDAYARGTLVGLTRGCGRAHIVRAALESIAYQTVDVLQAMERDAGQRITHLRVDGGASANNFLMQFQSDVLDAAVLRPQCAETTALGAAYLAGLTTGFYASREALREFWTLDRRYMPTLDAGQRSALLSGWDRAVGRSLDWAR